MRPPVPTTVPSRYGTAAGLLAAAAAAGAATLTAALSSDLRFPLVTVGDRVIDAAPGAVEQWAVTTLGTATKPTLLLVISALLAGAAVACGRWAVAGRLRLAVAVVGVLAGAGVTAAATDPDAGALAVLPSVTAGAAAAGVLVLAARWADRRTPAPASTAPDTTAPAGTVVSPVGPLDRRRFVVGAVGVGSLAVIAGSLGAGLQRRFDRTAERLAIRLPRAGRPLPAPPVDPAVSVTGLSPLFTPNRRFYRIDTALVVPRVSATTWELRVTGMVRRELRLTYDELLARDLVESDVTLSCVSNEVGGGLVGTARWLGVRLDELLDDAGVRPGADQVVGRSVDGWTGGFPLDAAVDGRPALVAVGMNGEPLPMRHGYPARLVVPGLYGYVSATKWLRSIELTRFDAFEGYWIPRGWAPLGPVKTQSRIDRPLGSDVPAGRTAVAGVAWAGVAGVAAVEVQVDDGAWTAAELGPSLGAVAWRQWWVTWDATPGRHRLRVRATDGTGATQPEDRSDVAPDGATGWHTVTVQVR